MRGDKYRKVDVGMLVMNSERECLSESSPSHESILDDPLNRSAIRGS